MILFYVHVSHGYTFMSQHKKFWAATYNENAIYYLG
jgi:hypothetical protein